MNVLFRANKHTSPSAHTLTLDIYEMQCRKSWWLVECQLLCLPVCLCLCLSVSLFPRVIARALQVNAGKPLLLNVVCSAAHVTLTLTQSARARKQTVSGQCAWRSTSSLTHSLRHSLSPTHSHTLTHPRAVCLCVSVCVSLWPWVCVTSDPCANTNTRATYKRVSEWVSEWRWFWWFSGEESSLIYVLVVHARDQRAEVHPVSWDVVVGWLLWFDSVWFSLWDAHTTSDPCVVPCSAPVGGVWCAWACEHTELLPACLPGCVYM